MAKGLFEFHAIVSKKEVFSSARVRAMVLNEMKIVSRWMRKDLELTSEYWKHKPDFENVIRYRGGDPLIRVGLIGTSIGNDHWEKVNRGTHYLPYTFLPDYAPMTSYPGQLGGNIPRTTLLVYKVYNRKSRKRIHARNWIGTAGSPGLMEDKYGDILQDAVDFAIMRGLEPK